MNQKKMSQKKISPFIIKLLSLLDDPASHGCVQWVSPETFVIREQNQFSQNILPKYYKHQNISSFIRQLNIYGFSKVKSTEQGHFYSNPNFIKNSRKKLKMIQRRSNIRSQTSKSEENDYENSLFQSSNLKMTKNCSVIKSQNQQYRRKNTIIKSQIKTLSDQWLKQMQSTYNIFCTLLSTAATQKQNEQNMRQKLQGQYKMISYILEQTSILKAQNVIPEQERIQKMMSFLHVKKHELEERLEKYKQVKVKESPESSNHDQNVEQEENIFSQNNLQNMGGECEKFDLNRGSAFSNNQEENFNDFMF